MRIWLAAATDNVCRYSQHCRHWTRWFWQHTELINFYFIESIKLLHQGLPNKHAQGRPPLWWHGFINSTPLEGQAAPPPWWWCLLGDLCFLCGFWLKTRQSDESYLCFRGVTKWATLACTIPKCVFCSREWWETWAHRVGFHTIL
jgi:hypothetical protein